MLSRAVALRVIVPLTLGLPGTPKTTVGGVRSARATTVARAVSLAVAPRLSVTVKRIV